MKHKIKIRLSDVSYPGKNTDVVYKFIFDSGADEHFANSLIRLTNVHSTSSIKVRYADKNSKLNNYSCRGFGYKKW